MPVLLALAMAGAQPAELPGPAELPAPARLSAAEVFALADAALAQGDAKNAEAAYRALEDDPDRRIRSEARFRLASLHAGRGRLAEAAVLLRRILDEEPGAQRVRLELARLLERMGDAAGARRALRAAQAGGLPPDVARIVDRYSDALRAQKPFGASFEIALAPDSNINRATRARTLETVIGDFELDADARARSGVGVAAEGQVYGRLPLDARTTLLARVTGAGRFYRRGAFDDVSLGVSAGPEFHLGADRLAIEAGAGRRWFGGETYAATATVTVNWFHPLGRVAQLRTVAALGLIDNRRSNLQDGRSYALQVGYERALSSRAGIGVTLAADRQDLRDRGHATTGGSISLFAYREIGAATVVATASYGRIEADRRLAIYPRRRADDIYRASLALSWRGLRIGGFAPLLRVTAERGRSSIALYDYKRLRTEFGLVRAF